MSPRSSPRGSDSRRAFSRRQWSRRWVAWRRRVALAVLLAAVGAAAWAVFFSSLLAVTGVEVEGERSLSEQRIARVAEVPMGGPLARVDLDEVATRVEQLRPVERVEVTRRWPDTVTLSVAERTAVALVERAGRRTLIDAAGVQFREVPGGGTARKGLPVIEAGGPRAAAEAAEVVSALPSELARRVAQVDATTMDSISLELKGGREVVWGSAEQSERKAEVLAVLVQRDGAVLDVSVPSAPTVSFG